jgi:tetratricopeptide (TPR) repeat protein
VKKKTINRVPYDVVQSSIVPFWTMGISSLYSNRNAIGGMNGLLYGIKMDNDLFDLYSQYIIQDDVNCITLEHLFKRYTVSKIDILQIDTEGYDYIIFKQFDFQKFQPYFIKIEVGNLQRYEFDEICSILEQNNYIYDIDWLDLYAYKIEPSLDTTFYKPYCESINHFQQGHQFEKQGKWQDAEISYHQARILNPKLFVYYYNLGNVVLKQGKINEAINYYNKAICLNPKSAWSHYSLGVAFHKNQQLDKAILSCNLATQIKPISKFYNTLGELFVQQGNIEESIKCFRKAIELNPHLCWSYVNLVEVMLYQGKIHDAVDYCRQAVKLNPHPSLCEKLRELLNQINQTEIN